jgi:hypothetical protein
MSATNLEIGVKQVTAQFIESVEVSKNFETKMIMSTEGGFGAAKAFDPKFEFTVKGRGSTEVEAGSSGGNLVPSEVDGKVIITSVKNSQTNDDFNSFEVTGVAYPGA